MTQGSVDTSIAGLQMSYLYQQAGRDYIVFERNDVAGWLYVGMTTDIIKSYQEIAVTGTEQTSYF